MFETILAIVLSLIIVCGIIDVIFLSRLLTAEPVSAYQNWARKRFPIAVTYLCAAITVAIYVHLA